MNIRKIIITIVFCAISIFLCTEKTHCVNIYIDDDGYVCIEMADHQKVSAIHYKTEGFTISRCVYNPCAKQLHGSLDYVGTNFSLIEPISSSDLSGGVYYNTWRIHITQLLQNVGASADWIKEVEDALSGDGPAVYIRYDSMLAVYMDEAETMKVPSSDPSTLFCNYATIDGTNPNEILNCGIGWGGNTQKDFNQHYNRYLLIGKQKPVDIPEVTLDEFISAERSPLEFWTGNFSNEWDLYNKSNPYSGIPSGETVDENRVIASRWYGETEVYARTKTSRDYTGISGKYRIKKVRYEEYVVDSWYDGYEWQYEYDTRRVVDDVTILSDSFYQARASYPDDRLLIPAVAYEYLYNASFYQLEEMDVYNNAFSSFLFYPGTEVPMTCYSTENYENIATDSRFEPVKWLPNDDKHITWADVPDNVDMYLFGGAELEPGDERIGQANEEAEKQFKADRDRIMDYIFNNTKTKNDSLVIDSVTYLKGQGAPGFEPSVGVNWLTKDMAGMSDTDILHTFCTESSSMKAPFVVGSISNATIGTVTDSTEDILIPEETDNGKYPTAMKVNYSRKIKNDNSLIKFSAGKDDFIDSVNNTDSRGKSMRGSDGFNALFKNTINCGPLDGCGHSGLSSYTNLGRGDVKFGTVKGHCLDSYGGIIFVHTPVISPFTIRPDTWDPNINNSEPLPNAQLDTEEFREDASQLILDNYYVLEWTQTDHVDRKGYGYSATTSSGEEYSKYDKYTINKYVKFPFEVEYAGSYYPKNTWIRVVDPGDYTKNSNYQPAASDNSWIPSSENHWRKLVFYIPSYAIECGGMTDENCYIKTLVEAKNVDGRFFEDHNPEDLWIYKEDGFTPDGWENAWEEKANILTEDQYAPEGARYATIYEDKVQLSGVIYDFTIVGSDDDDTFRYRDTGDHISGDVVPFCVYKEEKKVGLYNRYGLEETSQGLFSAVRYRADGSIARDETTGLPAWSPVNTLALIPGKSNCWNNMGYLIKGTTFSFSFKTIANLSDSITDYARIKPGFRYYSTRTNSWSDNIKIYYNSDVRDYHQTLVEFNPTADATTDMRDWDEDNRRVFKLSDEQFRMSYYNYRNTSNVANQVIGDWITPTIKRYNELRGLTGSNAFTEEEYMNKENLSYCLSDIYLASDTLLLSGEWEQLGRNTRGLGRESADYGNGLKTYAMAEGDWTGATAGEKWTYSAEQQEKFRASMQTWFGQYFVPAELYIVDLDNPETQQIITNAGLTPETFDLMDYMKTKDPGIRMDDEIFEKGDGYLVINFDIETFNSTTNGSPAHPHLKYYGGYDGSVNMWEKEGFNPDPGPHIPTGDLKDGDVAIINLNKSIRERYKAGIFNIN